jgi:hypothetical protein
MSDVVVYACRDGTHYLANVDGAYVRWPARADGWRARHSASEDDADPERELPPRLADLALRLSGADRGEG